MLNRSKILNELSSNIPTLSTNYNTEYEIAKSLWNAIKNDLAFAETLKKTKQPIPLPTWQGAVGTTNSINSIGCHDVIAIDGSQIYPDRHEGISCFVINIGTVFFKYRDKKSSVEFNSTPYLLSHTATGEFENKQEIVNAMRTEREFTDGLELMNAQTTTMPRLMLVDGSLIFWHLQVTQSEAKKQCLSRYVKILDQYYQNKQLLAGYISQPQSRELINIIRVFGQQQTEQLLELETLVDADIAHSYLQPYQRTILFQNHATVTEQYPEHSKPYFYYFNTGNEIARIEIPAWIALNNDYLSITESIIASQCSKGLGYPIALAEAHEQAVVSEVDREFFYATIQGMLHNQASRSSQKLLKKKRMPI